MNNKINVNIIINNSNDSLSKKSEQKKMLCCMFQERFVIFNYLLSPLILLPMN